MQQPIPEYAPLGSSLAGDNMEINENSSDAPGININQLGPIVEDETEQNEANGNVAQTVAPGADNQNVVDIEFNPNDGAWSLPLNEHGLPSARPGPRQTLNLDKATKELGKDRKPRRPKKKVKFDFFPPFNFFDFNHSEFSLNFFFSLR